MFQFADKFSDDCLYIAIKATKTTKDDISGKFNFHSLHNNIGVFIRDPKPTVPANIGLRFYLVYMDGTWWIQSHVGQGKKDKKHKCFLWDNSGGWFRIATKGSLIQYLIQLHGIIIILKETNPLLLNNEWDEADGNGGWDRKATIKIFNNEEIYKKYQNVWGTF